MSVSADIYAGVETILATIFPSHKKLVNPYKPEENDTLSLKRGYGFIFGPKTREDLSTGRYEKFRVEVTVINTVVHRGTDRDTPIRETAEKLLLDDQYLLIDYFRLNTAPIQKAWEIRWENDNGIEPVFPEKENYVMIRSVLSIIYSEGC